MGSVDAVVISLDILIRGSRVRERADSERAKWQLGDVQPELGL